MKNLNAKLDPIEHTQATMIDINKTLGSQSK